MKYFYSLLILLLLGVLIGSGKSQWRDETPFGPSDTFTSIDFVNPMKGYTTSENYIYKVTPLFALGSRTTFSSGTKFNSITFPDNTNGFAVGYNYFQDSGILVKTNNAGQNWSSEFQILGNSKLSDVCFVNSTTGWVSGKNLDDNQAIIGKSTDNGTTWIQSVIPVVNFGNLNSIYFTDELTGWAVGTGDNTGFGKIIKTTDGGSNWSELPSSISGNVKDVYFNDQNNGWICTDAGKILHSMDGGITWSIQYSNSFSVNAIKFCNEKIGWATGDNGLMLRTIDGGANWVTEDCGTNNNLNSIYAAFSNLIWVCGDNGKVLTREIFSVATSLTPMIGTSSWGDYDNDGDLDLALTGVWVPTLGDEIQVDERYSEIHKNNGDGTFTKIPDQMIKVADGSLDWGDYDNDGDLDLVIAGFYEDDTTAIDIAKIYRNDGNDIFTEVPSNLIGFESGFIQWADLDNDGNLDIISSGGIYRNMGNDIFTEITPHFEGVKAADLDNDGDLDILSANNSLEVYVNNGDFQFVSVNIQTQPGNRQNQNNYKNSSYNLIPDGSNSMMEFYGSYDIGDYDNDGDLDILEVGSNGTIIFRNEGNLNFTELTSLNLPDLPTGTGVFGDYDNDGDLDIFLTGGNTANDYDSGIYLNEGNDNFVHLPFYYDDLQIISWASAHWADFDNDGDLDLIVNGEAPHSHGKTKIYRNNSIVSNEIPTSPGSLNSIVSGYNVTLNWAKSFDNKTPQGSLNYNLVVGSEPGKYNTVSPMSELSNGFRRVVNLGNTNQNNTWEIKNLPHGRYYWEVQSVDNNFAGSMFSTEKTFAIPYSIHNSNIPAGDLSPVTFDSSLVTIQFTNANREDLNITIDRFNNVPGGSLPGNLANISDTYWMINVNSGIVNGVFNLILDLSQIPGVSDVSKIHLLQRTEEGTGWTDLGTPSDISQGTSAVVWSNLTNFSQFGLGGGSENPLPVELTSFSAKYENSSVKLNWRTETEIQNHGFEVERKSGESSWSTLGFVEGHGNSTTPRQYSFIDKSLFGNSKFVYRLKQIDNDGTFKYSNEVEIQLNPVKFDLSQNYPNPFNPSTKIKYQLPEESKVVIKVYNILGAEIIELVNEKKDPGIYEVDFDAHNLPSGTYIYRIVANDFSMTKKMILIK